jgi:hypothetical protein
VGCSFHASAIGVGKVGGGGSGSCVAVKSIRPGEISGFVVNRLVGFENAPELLEQSCCPSHGFGRM